VVFVSIDDIEVRRHPILLRDLRLDLSVVGFTPRSYGGALEFFTRLAERLRFDHLSWGSLKKLKRLGADVREVCDLGVLLDELSRKKVFLVWVPENTHFFNPSGFDPSKCESRVYALFVDEGSPLRHFFLVSKDDPRVRGASAYSIIGFSPWHPEFFGLRADFIEDPEEVYDWDVPEDFKRRVVELAKDPELHIDVYYSPCDSEHELRLSLIKDLLELKKSGLL
jgi:hypothetical protein